MKLILQPAALSFGVVLCACLQNVDVLRPVQPQGHDLPKDPAIPTFPPIIGDPGNNLQPVPSDPPLPTVVQPLPVDPSVAVGPDVRLSSSSSESAEGLLSGSSDSSSEEIGGPVALRPPFNFRYQRRERKKRQALMETSHHPVFLSDFPSGPSPFRSCPGPARYTTV